MEVFKVGDSGKKDDLLSDCTLTLSFIYFSLKMLMFSRNVRERVGKSPEQYEECITLWVGEGKNNW